MISVDKTEVFKNKAEWFEKLFGFKEIPETVQSKFTISTDENGDSFLISQVNNKKYSIGTFKCRDLKSFDSTPMRDGGKFNIIVGDGSENVDADIIMCETNPENDGSTFQMASNFNCLDHLPGKKPPNGYISEYITHHEQGGPGTVVCGPAVLYRQYFVDEVHLLERTPIIVDDGYAIDIPENDFDYSNSNLYQVGVHQNIDVTLGRAGRCNRYYRIIDNQRIHQVFCSTIPFGDLPESEFNLKVASYILTAEYRMTILAAIENSLKYPGRKGSNKLFLCLLGTGAFGNPIELVTKCIADCSDLIQKSGLEVNLTCFNQSIADEVLPFLKDTIEKTGGKVINL